MSRRTTASIPILLAVLTAAAANPASGQCPAGQTTIPADRDNTLYQDAAGSLSNGVGQYLFAGRSIQEDSISRRRAVLHFDVAGTLEPSAIIEDATLFLYLENPALWGTQLVTLHRALSDWGEGTSQAVGGNGGEGAGGPATADSATWLHTFWPTTFWDTPGGDFEATESATTVVDTNVEGLKSWTSPTLVSDVQTWFTTPTSNRGWLLQGNESNPATVARFHSRENQDKNASPPVLCVTLCSSCLIFEDGFEDGTIMAWSGSAGN